MTGSSSGVASSASASSSGVSGTYTGTNYPPATGNWAWPFDPTGVASTNLIKNEIHTVAPNLGSDFNWLIPDAAPFFRGSDTLGNKFQLIDQNTGLPLVEGIDYVFAYKFIDATISIGQPIYGAVQFLNQNYSGVVSLTYQTVGGAWTVPQNQIAEMLANITSNPITTTWDQVANLPYQFPPINHEFNIVDMVGMSDVVSAISGLASAITGQAASGAVQPTLPGNNLAAGAQFDIVCSDNLEYYVVTLSENVAFTVDTPIISVGRVRRIKLLLIQGGVGSNVATWPNNITWADGLSGTANGPVLATAPGAFDVIELIWADAQQGWLGFIAS